MFVCKHKLTRTHAHTHTHTFTCTLGGARVARVPSQGPGYSAILPSMHAVAGFFYYSTLFYTHTHSLACMRLHVFIFLFLFSMDVLPAGVADQGPGHTVVLLRALGVCARVCVIKIK